jgi:hypothetical protein
MRATFVLAVHSLKRVRIVAIAMAAVLVGFQFLLTQVAVVLDRNQAFGALATMVPEFMREMAGPSMLAFMSFSGIVALGFFHPIVLSSLLGLAIAIATEPAGEVETRFDDLTLTRPVPRAAIIARTVVVMAIVVGANPHVDGGGILDGSHLLHADDGPAAVDRSVADRSRSVWARSCGAGADSPSPSRRLSAGAPWRRVSAASPRSWPTSSTISGASGIP